mmetsp:Transcript_24756/g.53969  ORF Transcript_24756/g.53969 Transcript_24756/m.53969 type:complete len:262 (+) Transcript_24756:821-1606(+)
MPRRAGRRRRLLLRPRKRPLLLRRTKRMRPTLLPPRRMMAVAMEWPRSLPLVTVTAGRRGRRMKSRRRTTSVLVVGRLLPRRPLKVIRWTRPTRLKQLRGRLSQIKMGGMMVPQARRRRRQTEWILTRGLVTATRRTRRLPEEVLLMSLQLLQQQFLRLLQMGMPRTRPLRRMQQLLMAVTTRMVRPAPQLPHLRLFSRVPYRTTSSSASTSCRGCGTTRTPTPFPLSGSSWSATSGRRRTRPSFRRMASSMARSAWPTFT